MSQPPAPLSPAQQQDLVQRIGQACASAVPPGWRRLRVEYRAVGRHVEADVITTAPDGRDYPARPHPEAIRLLGVLRGGMYRPGRGTWLSATLLFTPQQPPRPEFRPDVEPLWRRPPPPLGFQDELRFFPRSEAFIPPWLRTRAGLPPLPAAWTPDTPPHDRTPGPAAPPPPPAGAPAAPRQDVGPLPFASAGTVGDAPHEYAATATSANDGTGSAAPQRPTPSPVAPTPVADAPATPRQDAGPTSLASGAPASTAPSEDTLPNGGAVPAAPQDAAPPAGTQGPHADKPPARRQEAEPLPPASDDTATDPRREGATVPANDGAAPARHDATDSVAAAVEAAATSPEGTAASAAEGGAAPSDLPGVADPPATTVAEMRTPRVYDGLDEAGRPVVEREAVPEAERERVLAYLESAPAVLASRSYDADAFDPARTDVVPLTFRTDGSWVWPGAVAYYLREHAVAPDPELLSHIRGRRFAVPEVGEPARELALSAVTGETIVH